MANNVLVILGAGASFQLIPYVAQAGLHIGWFDAECSPPLTQNVFRDDAHTRDILKKYRGARNLAAPIRLALANGDQLEPLLRAYRDSTSQPLASQFIELPLYLQDFFAIISRYTDQPTNYQVLAHELFRDPNYFDRIFFLTLNYETLLDEVLFPDYLGQPLKDNIDAYIGDRCSLIKLHGSINWARPFPYVTPHNVGFSDEVYLAAIRSLGYSGISDRLTPEVVLRPPHRDRWEPQSMDNGERKWRLFYPSLSVPLGTYDPSFACPRKHLDALKSFLPTCTNVLAIGSSARDDDLLELLDAGLPSAAVNFHIVDQDEDSAMKSWRSWSKVQALHHSQTHHTDGFSGFIKGSGLQTFLETSA